jgi:hypothetical protein
MVTRACWSTWRARPIRSAGRGLGTGSRPALAVMAQADSVTAIAEWTGDVPAEALQALGARRDRWGRLVPAVAVHIPVGAAETARVGAFRHVRRLAHRASPRGPDQRAVAGDRAGRQDRSPGTPTSGLRPSTCCSATLRSGWRGVSAPASPRERGRRPAPAGPSRCPPTRADRAVGKELALGGTRFVGQEVVASAVGRGWDVTTFNRGISGPDTARVRALRGDRTSSDDVAGLTGAGPWDAVVDTPVTCRARCSRSAGAWSL